MHKSNNPSEDENTFTQHDYYDNKLLYNNFVANTLTSQEKIISGCLFCNVECASTVPFDDRNIIEVYSKGLSGLFFCLLPDSFNEELKIKDEIVFQFEGNLENGTIQGTGEIVKVKRKRLGLFGEELNNLVRKFTPEDISILKKNRADEFKAKQIFHEKLIKFKIDMKLVDVHYQFDRNKLFFFYTADGRVDFRDLAKDLASEFRTRIELRQIGVRDEAKRIGGIGVCGREFCCSSFLGSFKRISTQLANEQNYSSNISKLSGPCGKLKCCLSYEMKECPQVNEYDNLSEK